MKKYFRFIGYVMFVCFIIGFIGYCIAAFPLIGKYFSAGGSNVAQGILLILCLVFILVFGPAVSLLFIYVGGEHNRN